MTWCPCVLQGEGAKVMAAGDKGVLLTDLGLPTVLFNFDT